MYMLDTDICSYILRERPLSVLQKFKKTDSSSLCISAITMAELLYGAERSQSKKINASVVEDFTSRLIILDWDIAAVREYAILRSRLEAKVHIIGNMDLMIAAHALSIKAHIVTNNMRHFLLVPGLTVENWAEGILAH